jgi:hypothetical protein
MNLECGGKRQRDAALDRLSLNLDLLLTETQSAVAGALQKSFHGA